MPLLVCLRGRDQQVNMEQRASAHSQPPGSDCWPVTPTLHSYLLVSRFLSNPAETWEECVCGRCIHAQAWVERDCTWQHRLMWRP